MREKKEEGLILVAIVLGLLVGAAITEYGVWRMKPPPATEYQLGPVQIGDSGDEI